MAEMKTGRINILDKHLAELIAAGEVVERPASVVKELVENAVDAGAKNISVSIKNGGVSLIQITDDGCGIIMDDLPTAFKRHATSKIIDETDLYGISTLGFRGEALASVAAVAKVDMLTKTRDTDFGAHYLIEGGEEIELEEAGCADGTTIIVRDLFYNTPARMKFLKKDVSEGNAVAGVVDKLALSHPEISFKFTRDGKQVLSTPGDGRLSSAVYAVLGRQFAESLIEVDYTLGGIKVSGLVTKPVMSRTSRSMQYFFINGRYVKSTTAMAALEAAYKNSIMTGKYPGCVLDIEISPHEVDVNVHPAKTEVRFSNDRPVFEAVYHAVRSAIESADSPPVMDFAEQTSPGREVLSDKPDAAASEPKSKPDMLHSSASTSFVVGGGYRSRPSIDIFPDDMETGTISGGEDLSEVPAANKESIKPPDICGKNAESTYQPHIVSAAAQITEEDPQPTQSIDEGDMQTEISGVKEEAKPRFVGEVFSTYIIIELEDNVIFIDKHAAHERIIFERLKNSMSTDRQLLLSPIIVRLGSEDYNALMQNLGEAEKCGFEIEDFGQGSVAVRSLPPFLSESDAEDVVTQMADRFRYGGAASSDKIDWILHTTACRAAIKAGHNSSEAELMELAVKVVKDGGVRYCPHGRPTAFVLRRADIEKQFKRIL